MEWYEVYSDGHHEGFQAKFHASLEDALGGMLESVKLDLEGHYAKIESAASPALRHLREEEPLTRDEQREVIALLDMYLERGRYAD